MHIKARDLGLRHEPTPILGGSWDLVSKVIRTLSRVIQTSTYAYHIYFPSY